MSRFQASLGLHIPNSYARLASVNLAIELERLNIWMRCLWNTPGGNMSPGRRGDLDGVYALLLALARRPQFSLTQALILLGLVGYPAKRALAQSRPVLDDEICSARDRLRMEPHNAERRLSVSQREDRLQQFTSRQIHQKVQIRSGVKLRTAMFQRSSIHNKTPAPGRDAQDGCTAY